MFWSFQASNSIAFFFSLAQLAPWASSDHPRPGLPCRSVTSPVDTETECQQTRHLPIPKSSSTDTFLSFSPRPGPRSEYTETQVEIDNRRQPYNSPIDIAEREYRERFRPQQAQYNTTVDTSFRPQQFQTSENIRVDEYTVDPATSRQTFHEEVKISDETVEPTRFTLADQKSKMGYYDEDGESFLSSTLLISVKSVHS